MLLRLVVALGVVAAGVSATPHPNPLEAFASVDDFSRGLGKRETIRPNGCPTRFKLCPDGVTCMHENGTCCEVTPKEYINTPWGTKKFGTCKPGYACQVGDNGRKGCCKGDGTNHCCRCLARDTS